MFKDLQNKMDTGVFADMKITEKDLKHSEYLYDLYIAWANEYRNHKCYVDNIIFKSV